MTSSVVTFFFVIFPFVEFGVLGLSRDRVITIGIT